MKIALPAATLLLTSTAAMAELAPQDIINSWDAYYTRMNGTITTGQPIQTGTTTRYPDIVAQTKIMGNTATYTIDYIDMESNADGSVDITFSPNSAATNQIDANGSKVEGHVSYDIGSLRLHAEGTPEDMRYSFNAPIVTMQMNQTRSDPALTTSITFALEGLQGTVASTSTPDGPLAQTGDMSISTASATVTFEPQNSQRAYLSYHGESISLFYDMAVTQWPETAGTSGMALPEDMVFGMTLTTGPATTTVDKPVTTTGGKGRLTFTQSGGELTAAYAENALSYGVTATEARLALANTPARPIDFTAAFNRFHFGITLPMSKSDTPAPFALALALQGFTLGSNIWDKIDPEATLGRTPASFAFSLNGTAKLFVDLFDQSALTALHGAPFELRSLSLQSLRLNFEGMGLTGNGDVAFNNERIDPMSGLPEPTGVLDFSVTGALEMLDKIGRLGFVEPMVIIGAKGALGMFATPTEKADSFTSRIEFSEGGGVWVNGQQLR